jgi:hypothetical protein
LGHFQKVVDNPNEKHYIEPSNYLIYHGVN